MTRYYVCIGHRRRQHPSVRHTPLLITIALLACCLVATLLAGCSTTFTSAEELSGRLLVTGSTALQPLVTSAAKLFMKHHSGVTITVLGGGSKTGLNDVTSGKMYKIDGTNRLYKVDIGDSDIYADPAIYPDPNLTDHIVCVVPFTMIVNPDVHIPSLTKEQIVGIFSTGQYHNWNELGGPDLPITPVVRPSTSGTRDTFRKYILDGRDEKGQLLDKDSSTLVRDTVAQTPGAIGYVSLSWLNNSVRAIDINGSTPTKGNIAAGNYSFWSYEHMYTMGDNTPLLEQFLDFMIEPEVQHEAQNSGYIPIDSMKVQTTESTGVARSGEQRNTSSSLSFVLESEASRHVIQS